MNDLTPDQRVRYQQAYDYLWARLTVPPWKPETDRRAWEDYARLFSRAYALSDADDMLKFYNAYHFQLWRADNPDRVISKPKPSTVNT